MLVGGNLIGLEQHVPHRNIQDRDDLASIMDELIPAIFTGALERDRRGAEHEASIHKIESCLTDRS